MQFSEKFLMCYPLNPYAESLSACQEIQGTNKLIWDDKILSFLNFLH
jgi:hypothetical protein